MFFIFVFSECGNDADHGQEMWFQYLFSIAIFSLAAAKTIQPMPRIPMSLTEVSLAIFSLAEAKTVQPMPDSNSRIHVL